MGDRGGLLERILHWLRAGYPEGVPQHDYVALLGILQRTLTADEVEQLAHRLRETRGSSVSDDEIRTLIRETALEEPSDTDIRRVASRLAEGGWPLQSTPVEATTSQQV